MPTPSPPADAEESERELLTKVRWSCSRIVRGQHAADTYKVKLHYTQTIASAIMASLAGAGILVVQQSKPTAEGGWITAGAVVAFLSGALTGVYKVLGVEKSALLALACHETFSQLYAQLEVAIAQPNPTDDVNAVQEAVQKHLQSFALVITMKTAPEAEVTEMYDALVKDHPKWTFPPPEQNPPAEG